MASFSPANLQTVAGKLGYIRKLKADAVTAIEAAIAAFEATAAALGDIDQIGAALAVNAQEAVVAIEAVFESAFRTLAGKFQSSATAPVLTDDTTQATSFAEYAADALDAAGFTEGLLNNHFVEGFRRINGTGSLPAAICAGPDDTEFASAITITGATTFTGGTIVDEPIDTTLYGGCLLCMTVTSSTAESSGSNIIFTLKGTDSNGSAREWTVTIPDGSLLGTVFNAVPSGGSKFYPVVLTEITVADGASGTVTLTSKTTQTLD